MNYYGPRELYEYNGDGVKEPVGTYHYTRKRGSGSNTRVWPLGYCAGMPATTREQYDNRKRFRSPSRKYNEGWDDDLAEKDRRALRIKQELVERNEEKYHHDGHETKEEAIECYTEYCLDNRLVFWDTEINEFERWMGLSTDTLSRPIEDHPKEGVTMEDCSHPDCDTLVANPTAAIRDVGLLNEMYICSDHCNRESVEEFWTAPEEAWSSY